MVGLGLCVSPRYLPSVEMIQRLRPASLASILYSISDLDALFHLADAAGGIPVLVSLNNECAEVNWWNDWEGACRLIAERYAGRDLAVTMGHELDLFWSANPADCPPEFGASLVNRAAPILRPAGITVILSPVAGPKWVEWMTQALASCKTNLSGVAGDFYGQRPDGWNGWGFGQLADCIATAHALSGLPVYLREYGIKLADADPGGSGDVARMEQNQATHLGLTARMLASQPNVASANWFAFSDGMGKPDERGLGAFGLLRSDSSERPAFSAFSSLGQTGPLPVAAPLPTPVAPTYSFDDLVAISNQVAEEYKIPRLLLAACGIAESGLTYDARRPSDPSRDQSSWPDVSGGAWQQEAQYDPDYQGLGGRVGQYPGPDIIAEVIRRQQDPRRAAQVAAKQLKGYYAQELRALPGNADLGPESDLRTVVDEGCLLRAMYRYNYPSGYGSPWSDGNAQNYQRGLDLAKQIPSVVGLDQSQDVGGQPVDPAPAPLPVERPDVPDEVTLQRNTWSCAVRSTYAALWELHTLGLGPEVSYGDGGPADVYDWLVPSLDDSSVGLHYGDGHELESLLNEKGYWTDRIVGASLTQALVMARQYILLLGFHGWGPAGHWVMCRGVDPDGLLILENPAGSYQGISDRIGPGHYNTFGPVTLIAVDSHITVNPPVLVDAPSTPDPSPAPVPPEEEDPAVIAALKAKIEKLETLVGCAYNPDGNVRVALGRVIHARSTGKGAISRGDMLEQLQAVDTWLESNRPR